MAVGRRLFTKQALYVPLGGRAGPFLDRQGLRSSTGGVDSSDSNGFRQESC